MAAPFVCPPVRVKYSKTFEYDPNQTKVFVELFPPNFFSQSEFEGMTRHSATKVIPIYTDDRDAYGMIAMFEYHPCDSFEPNYRPMALFDFVGVSKPTLPKSFVYPMAIRDRFIEEHWKVKPLRMRQDIENIAVCFDLNETVDFEFTFLIGNKPKKQRTNNPV